MVGLELTKWYADCVTERGDLAIVYSAELRLASVPVHYEALLLKEAGGVAKTSYSLRRNALPRMEDGCVRWESREWAAKGVWQADAEAQSERLYATEGGELVWNCVAPRAVGRVELAGREMQGWGYAEELRLTIAPWKLPIKRLRWGRFVNATDALVWIDWEGSYSTRVVIVNGERVEADCVSDDEVALGAAGVLQLGAREVVREGELGKTALAVFPGLRTMFPSSVLGMRECKWVSRAVLRRAGSEDSVGWAVHEVVEWP